MMGFLQSCCKTSIAFHVIRGFRRHRGASSISHLLHSLKSTLARFPCSFMAAASSALKIPS